MNNLINFIETEINQKYKKNLSHSFCHQTNTYWTLNLKESDKKATNKGISIFLGKEVEYKDAIAIQIPEIQKTKQNFQLFLKDRDNICDYFIFIPKDEIVILVELKGKHLNNAKKQISLGYSFLKYILSIYNEEKKEYHPKTIRLIIRQDNVGARYTNPNRYYTKDKRNMFFSRTGGCNLFLKNIVEQWNNKKIKCV